MTERDKLLKADLEDLSLGAKIALFCIKKHKNIKKMRLHKMAFLVDRIFVSDNSAFEDDAEPYYFGMFMEDLAEELREMSEEGIVSEKYGEYGLTKYGDDLVNLFSDDLFEMSALIDILKVIPDIELVKILYEIFPEYTEKSKIKDKFPHFKNLKIYNFDIKDIGPHGKKIDVDGETIIISI